MELDYKTIFKELNDNGIDYLVVGGLAVNLFGVPRLTYDIDLMIHMNPENIEKLVSKLTHWGYKPKIPVNPLEFADEEKRNLWISEKGMKAFNLFSEHLPIGEIDIVIYSPIPYKILKERAVKIQIQDIVIPVISIHDLIEIKLQTGRKQDLSDVEYLKKIIEK
jgi:predicted nucleotidyltransferase